MQLPALPLGAGQVQRCGTAPQLHEVGDGQARRCLRLGRCPRIDRGRPGQVDPPLRIYTDPPCARGPGVRIEQPHQLYHPLAARVFRQQQPHFRPQGIDQPPFLPPSQQLHDLPARVRSRSWPQHHIDSPELQRIGHRGESRGSFCVADDGRMFIERISKGGFKSKVPVASPRSYLSGETP